MNGTAALSKHGHDGHGAANDAVSSSAPPSNPASTSAEELTGRVLQFLSTASTETIGGIAVGLAACTYLILGKVGLVLIGALGGIILHATWEGQSSTSGSADVARREKTLDILKRILDMREEATKDGDEDEVNEVIGNNFEGFRPETAAALSDLVDAVIRDYVKWWYHPILPLEQCFPAASRQTLTKFLVSVSKHLSRKRPADTFLDFLTNSSSIVIVFFAELSSALSVSQGSNVPPAEAVYTYLSANRESSLANILSQKQQSRKFQTVAEDVLESFLEKPTYNCDSARIFLREILAKVVLEMTLKSCSKPEWINVWIVYLLEKGEPDISQAIDVGMGAGKEVINPFDGIDGNVGNVRLAKPPKSQAKKQEEKRHQKRLSKAEEAMEEAMGEAQRLSQMIAEEDAKRVQNPEKSLEVAPKSLVAPAEQIDASVDFNTTTPSKEARSPVLDEKRLENEVKSPRATDNFESPASPKSARLTASPVSPQAATSFTSFDQILPQSSPVALQEGSRVVRRKTLSQTLQNATITIYDDSTAMDKGKMRNKPIGDYMVQIEPASSEFPGWMIVRRYENFETLHEVLRRIAQVSGVAAFTEQHNTLPNWKEHTKASLRGELERYLRDACWYQPLADSEGMKRFLEKDQGQSNSSTKAGFHGIGWATPSAFETMGKGVLDVLTSAPKGVAEGGKAIGGGITGVLTNIGSLGQKRANGSSNTVGTHTSGRSSTSTLPSIDSMNSTSGLRKGRGSEESLPATPVVHTQPPKVQPMERRPSYNSIAEDESEREPRMSSARSSTSGRRSAPHSRDPSRAPSRKGTPLSSPMQGSMYEMRLPPPPSDMPDDYGSHFDDLSPSRSDSISPTTRSSISIAPPPPLPGRPPLSGTRTGFVPGAQSPRKPRKEPAPLTEHETRQAVELLFAVINEMYTLSSAWNIRRTILNAAKTYLLRPNNPSLSSIQSLIQDSVIASNTSDAGIATHLRKLRENTLPSEEELKSWPLEMKAEDKERLRIKARKLLVERGMPAALTGVMGQAATAEAMGRIFDCLQIEEVARGLMFGLLLQGVSAIVH